MPTFAEIVERSLALLERRRRVSHTALRLEFALDDATFAALRYELVDVLGAADDDGRILAARDGHAATPAPPPASAPAAVPAPPAEPAGPAVPARELVTVLLCDLAETPDLAALDAQARNAVTARFAAMCGEVAARRRGHLLPWISDGVAILFGHDGAQDDDAPRAVRCGWEILRSLDAARRVIERDFGVSVCARLGIATGAAAAADAFGDTPRLAGRVQAGGAPDRVSVDSATHERARAHFDFEPVAGGLFELRSPRDADMGTRAPAPLVGRSAERSLLRALAERAADGTCAAVLVRGEAGVGKTRLLDELAAGAGAELGMTLLRCASSPYHRGSPLHPLLDGLRRHWELDGPDASARLARHARGLPGGERAVALLADQLGVALPDGVSPPAAMSPRRRRRETLAVVVAALTAEAREAPLLLVVEDLHWADPTTLELIGTLLDGPREVALMVALTARSEYVPPPSTVLQRIELGCLGPDEGRRLAEAVAAGETLADGLAADLAQRAGGSPLMIEELTRTVLATQDPAAGGAVTLYGCLMARLDRDTAARSAAQLAATIGREFDVALLEAVGGIERSALEWAMERLVQEDVVVRAGAGRYAFRHTLLQEAARSSLGKEVLREHNLRIARALKESFPHVAAAEPERLARHLEYGGALPRSVRRWRQAGLQALSRHALHEAAAHFQRALDLTARTPDGDERRAAELSLRVLAGLVVAMQDGWDSPAAVAHYARAEQLSHLVTGAPMLVRCMLGLTTFEIVTGRLEEALALAREQVKVAEGARDRELVLEAECEAGAALLYLGRHRDALPRFARAVELYEPDGHREHVRRYGRNPAAVALANRGLALACRGDRAGARDAIAQAAAVLREHRHPYTQVWVQCAAASAALVCGEREVVRREAAVALRIAGDEGFGDWLAHASVLHGWARAHAGEHDEGLEECRSGVARWASGGIVVLRPFLHGLLADALRVAGDPEHGIVAVDQALTGCVRGERWCEPELHRIRAELLLACGRRPGALRAAQTAVALSRRSGAGGWERCAETTLRRMSGAAPVA